jgi:hypothetical protein
LTSANYPRKVLVAALLAGTGFPEKNSLGISGKEKTLLVEILPPGSGESWAQFHLICREFCPLGAHWGLILFSAGNNEV